MKNQYFGDTRDLFKYDLVLHLLERLDLPTFTFVPMLTPDDGSGEGGRVDYARARAGTDNTALCGFLQRCVLEGRRDIRELDPFFAGKGHGIHTYHPPFEEGTRLGYFYDLPLEWLRSSVVVLDPDNGMEVPSGRGAKWLRYDELRHLCDHMDEGSVLLVFQFIPRVRRETYIPMVARRMVERSGVGRPVHWVSDNQVVFYGLSGGRRGELGRALTDYSGAYGLLNGSH